MAHKDAADFRLTIDGIEYPFVLAKENGRRLWNEGVAPTLTPQQRINQFSYEHVPPEIDVIFTAEDWSGGAGYEDSNDGTRYAYSQGVDLSWPNRAHLSPQRQSALESDGTAIAAAPAFFANTSLGLFLLAGAYIYEYDLPTKAWVERDDASGDGENYTDLVEMDGVLYAARGDSADYKYSSNGTTWTAFTDADKNQKFFAVRGISSAQAVLWGATATGLVRNTTNGQNSGVAWSNDDAVGHTSETVNGMIEADDALYVFKKEGFYRYTGSATEDVWKARYLDDENGKNAFVWVDGRIYVPYGDRLIQYDPLGDTSLRAVFPYDDMDELEIKGSITAVGGDNNHLFLAVKNRAGNTYIIKGRPGNGWHTLAYLGANDCNALIAVGPGVAHSTNPALVFGYGTAASYFILPRHDLHPEDDPAYRFDTGGGTVYGPWYAYGARAFAKFLNRGTVLGSDLSAARDVVLKYEVEGDGTGTILTAEDSGFNSASLTSEVKFHRIRYEMTLASPTASASPVVRGLTLHATLNPPRKRRWQPVVRLEETVKGRDGVTLKTVGVDGMKSLLFDALEKRITLTHDATAYTVKLLNCGDAVGIQHSVEGGEEQDTVLFQLDIVEISPLSSDVEALVYGRDAWGGGRVWA